MVNSSLSHLVYAGSEKLPSDTAGQGSLFTNQYSIMDCRKGFGTILMSQDSGFFYST